MMPGFWKLQVIAGTDNIGSQPTWHQPQSANPIWLHAMKIIYSEQIPMTDFVNIFESIQMAILLNTSSIVIVSRIRHMQRFLQFANWSVSSCSI
jgi:hypothetical protein